MSDMAGVIATITMAIEETAIVVIGIRANRRSHLLPKKFC
jgi:hypothetical protein